MNKTVISTTQEEACPAGRRESPKKLTCCLGDSSATAGMMDNKLSFSSRLQTVSNDKP